MTDVMTKAQRSACMSKIRGRYNQGTELKFRRMLRVAGLRGWRRHLDLPGRPDFAFPRARIAVFVDGCFWHGCKRCYQAPKTNPVFWHSKINRNKQRDREVNKVLLSRHWAVVRIRECRLAKGANRELFTLQKQLMSRAMFKDAPDWE